MGTFGIVWGAWNSGHVFLLFVAFASALTHRLNKKHEACRLLIGNSFLIRFAINFSPNRLRLKDGLSFVGYYFLILALMHPQWNQKDEIIAQNTRDVFIALDISKSMLSQDMGKSRLDCAKKKIKELLHRLSCERVGLILFSGSTFVQCPLTKDYSAFFMFLDHIDVETISSGSTSLDQAIGTAITAFKATGTHKNKLLLVVTDGEDFSDNLADATQKACDAGVRVCTLGVGSEQGGPIPLFNSQGKPIGHQKDRNGVVVISKLNDSLLRSVSKQTGGTYVRATKRSTDIKKLVKYIKSFETESIEDTKMSGLQEQYPFILLISFFFLAIEWVL